MKGKKPLDLRKEEVKQIFLSYLDDNDNKVAGYFILIKFTDNYIQVKTKGGIVTIPIHRVLKIKEKIKNEENEKENYIL